jgi:hypothetical protein
MEQCNLIVEKSSLEIEELKKQMNRMLGRINDLYKEFTVFRANMIEDINALDLRIGDKKDE